MTTLSRAEAFCDNFYQTKGQRTFLQPFRMLMAFDRDCVIGDSATNGLPWRCKPDMVNFKKLTMGHVVVLGVKTFLGMVKSWPNDHVLQGRSVVVVFAVDEAGYLELDTKRSLVAAKAASYGKALGDRIHYVPVPREIFTGDCPAHALAACQEEITGDIMSFVEQGQQAFVCGGAALNELLYEKCYIAHLTLIEHTSAIKQRVFLGSKVSTLVRSRFDTLWPKTWSDTDQPNDTKCYFSNVTL